MSTANINIKTDEVIGTISPDIYGHFTEHLGGVIYDGVWVGPDSSVPNINGIRKQLVDDMKRLEPSVIRWPGGCFADHYNWQDGIGPREKRPRRHGFWQDVTEPNHFGTHEFMEFCRLCGAEPYFAGNLGGGTVENFHAWIDYCNAPAGSTTRADIRAENGSREPFNIKFWGVGNENWGCGGNFCPEDYCTEYRKFVTGYPGYTPLHFVACGPNGNDVNWTKRFMKKWRDYYRTPLHGWSCHYYCGSTGSAVDYTVDQWYQQLKQAYHMDKLVRDQWDTLAEFDPEHKIKLVIDEWGCWHPEGTEINPRHLFEQIGTIRDAVAAGITLDIFNRHPEKVEMANVAQLINNLQSLFLADGPQFVRTANYYVFEMYKVHKGAQAVKAEIDSPLIAFKNKDENAAFPTLLGAASIKDGKLAISVVNTDALQETEACIQLNGAAVKSGKITVLAADDIHAHNSFEKPDVVVSKSSSLAVSGDSFKHTFAPASVNVIELELA